MSLWQGRSHRKPTGGILHPYRKKRRSEVGSDTLETSIGAQRTISARAYGGRKNLKITVAEYANITDSKTGRTQKTKIKSVIENAANPHYVRRNIVTKGAIIETDIGKARVTSRPGKDGTVNGVLLE